MFYKHYSTAGMLPDILLVCMLTEVGHLIRRPLQDSPLCSYALIVFIDLGNRA